MLGSPMYPLRKTGLFPRVSPLARWRAGRKLLAPHVVALLHGVGMVEVAREGIAESAADLRVQPELPV